MYYTAFATTLYVWQFLISAPDPVISILLTPRAHHRMPLIFLSHLICKPQSHVFWAWSRVKRIDYFTISVYGRLLHHRNWLEVAFAAFTKFGISRTGLQLIFFYISLFKRLPLSHTFYKHIVAVKAMIDKQSPHCCQGRGGFYFETVPACYFCCPSSKC